MDSVYKMVMVADRLPDLGLKQVTCFVSDTSGSSTFTEITVLVRKVIKERFKYWLEEIKLPTEEEIKEAAEEYWGSSHFKAGVKHILDYIEKGGEG